MCKTQGVDLFCYVGDTKKETPLLVAFTKSNESLITGLCETIGRFEGVYTFILKLHNRLKKPHLW